MSAIGDLFNGAMANSPLGGVFGPDGLLGNIFGRKTAAPVAAPTPSTQADGQKVLDGGGVKNTPGSNIAANNPASQGGTLLGGYFDRALS